MCAKNKQVDEINKQFYESNSNSEVKFARLCEVRENNITIKDFDIKSIDYKQRATFTETMNRGKKTTVLVSNSICKLW